ncbi:hypothetical protein [Kitasatospora azatica]|uniref:hypothetical protein n=1 Tax=Kitasatospora azatica TaxID=58347 RepID=UPI00055ED855|nr:hypothetical protein [Kitasatospora azatica]
MLVSLIVAGEIAFWLLIAAGLALRYPARRPRAGAAVLLAVPLVDLVVLGATVLDLRHGATANASHGLAALYVGFALPYGPYLVRWADGHAAHRFTGAPRPHPGYGARRARHEWRMLARTLLAAGISALLLAAMIALTGDPARTQALTGWYRTLAVIAGVNLVVAASYTVFPKQPPRQPQGRSGRAE